MAGKPRCSPEDRAARHERYKARLRRLDAIRSRREEAELALARATIAAHKMIGEAIEAAFAAGIPDPHGLVAVYVSDIAKAREADLAREREEAKNEGV